MTKRASVLQSYGKYGSTAVKYKGQDYALVLNDSEYELLSTIYKATSSSLLPIKEKVVELCKQVDKGCPPPTVSAAFMTHTGCYYMITQPEDLFD